DVLKLTVTQLTEHESKNNTALPTQHQGRYKKNTTLFNSDPLGVKRLANQFLLATPIHYSPTEESAVDAKAVLQALAQYSIFLSGSKRTPQSTTTHEQKGESPTKKRSTPSQNDDDQGAKL